MAQIVFTCPAKIFTGPTKKEWTFFLSYMFFNFRNKLCSLLFYLFICSYNFFITIYSYNVTINIKHFCRKTLHYWFLQVSTHFYWCLQDYKVILAVMICFRKLHIIIWWHISRICINKVFKEWKHMCKVIECDIFKTLLNVISESKADHF